MKAPLSWLKDYVDICVSSEILADKLVKAGFEIEEIIRPYEDYVNIVVGRIEGLKKHPNADKLQICDINIGTKRLNIVTGATNVKVGDYVPVALDAARLPDGKKIVAGMLRGEMSEGMLCGGSELKLTANDYKNAGIDGIFILPELRLGMDINEFLGTNDVVLDVAVTANRPDCNSIIGIAREVAAVLGVAMRAPKNIAVDESGDINALLCVKVSDKELCPRYMAKAVRNIRTCESPEQVKQRLRLVGLRPINNIVDITNYILIDIGQPMHAFDYSNIGGSEIVVRRASEGEKITTLDGTVNALSTDNLVICDANSPMAVAGIMGGMNSGINNDTKTIIFESARFKRDNIRKSSKALNLRSDSSSRFEKGVDYISQEMAIEKAISMLAQSGCGDVVRGVIDTLEVADEPRVINVQKSKIDEILGIVVPHKEVVDILTRLQFSVMVSGDELSIAVPRYREDIVGVNDIAEEVIRIYGYDNIVSKNLDGKKQTRGGRDLTDTVVQRVKGILSGFGGFMEALSYSFISPKFIETLRLKEDDCRKSVIKILNPLGEDMSVMRTTLLPSMINIAATNINNGNKCARLYEIGKVYFPKSLPIDDTAIEIETLMMATFGEKEDFFTLKNALTQLMAKLNVELTFIAGEETFLHPGRQADIFLNAKKIGYIGQLHPSVAKSNKIDQNVYVSELDLAAVVQASQDFLPFVPIGKFPAMQRDLAFVLDDEVTGGEIMNCIKAAAGDLMKNISIFDVYKGKGIPEGKKSVAVNMVFRRDDRTLKDDEVSAVINAILDSMNSAYSAKLRE